MKVYLASPWFHGEEPDRLERVEKVLDSFEEKDSGYSLHISGKIPDGSELIIMHLPEKKAKSFKNRYKNHIIAPYDDI